MPRREHRSEHGGIIPLNPDGLRAVFSFSHVDCPAGLTPTSLGLLDLLGEERGLDVHTSLLFMAAYAAASGVRRGRVDFRLIGHAALIFDKAPFAPSAPPRRVGAFQNSTLSSQNQATEFTGRFRCIIQVRKSSR